MQIQLSTSPSHSILTPGQPVPALTLQRQAPGGVATVVPSFKSLENDSTREDFHGGKRELNSGLPALEAGTFPLGQRGGVSKKEKLVCTVWGRSSSVVVFGLDVHSVAGSILLWGHFPVEGIFPMELPWVQTPVSKKLFRMRV